MGLALIGISRGYRVILIVPEKFVGPKTAVMKVLGAEVILTSTEAGIQGAIAKATEIAASLPNAFVPQQFENPANPEFHYRTTAVEVEEQLGRCPEAVVIGAGTGGTFTGLARYFKERAPATRAVLVEPQGSIWGGGPPGPHKVEGIGNSFWPGALDRSLVEKRIYPAIHVLMSATRREELLYHPDELERIHVLRKQLAELPPVEAMEVLIKNLNATKTNKGVFENL